MRVWIVQVLCPERHCITAMAGEAESRTEAERLIAAPLRETMTGLLASGALNPWCGLCGAKAETWRCEPGRTRWPTMEEAQPELRRSEQEQYATRAIWGDTHLGKPQ